MRVLTLRDDLDDPVKASALASIGRKSEVTGFDVWHCGQAIVGKFVSKTWGEDWRLFASPVRMGNHCRRPPDEHNRST